MRAHEFTSEMKIKSNLRLFAKPGVYSLLEAYQHPEQELEIVFKELASEYGKHYYNADIIERATGDLRVKAQFVLDENDPERVDVGNIEPFLRPGEQGKMVNTSMTADATGLDLGHRGVAWTKKKIRDFAKAQGFNIEKITSSTRYTGARAFNNPGDVDGMPRHFDVDTKLNEMVIYECRSDSARIYLILE